MVVGGFGMPLEVKPKLPNQIDHLVFVITRPTSFWLLQRVETQSGRMTTLPFPKKPSQK